MFSPNAVYMMPSRKLAVCQLVTETEVTFRYVVSRELVGFLPSTAQQIVARVSVVN